MKRAVIAALCVMLAGLCACGQGAPEEILTTVLFASAMPTMTVVPITAETKPGEFAAYAIAIEAYNDLPDNHAYANAEYYAFYDIDHNDTCELLLGQVMHNDIELCRVYTIRNGIAVWQEEFIRTIDDRGSRPILYKNGTIKSFCDYDDGIFCYYQIVNGELKLLTRLVDDSSPEFYIDNYHRSDGLDGIPRAIAKAEFNRLKKEFEGNGQTVALDWKPLAEYGR